MNAPYDRLVYFADPMCSWCYGFGPALRGFAAAHPQLKLTLVMGGLRPYTKEPMMAAQKKQIREHWQHVQQASGQTFSDALLMREGFVYDTEPACRALVSARSMQYADTLSFLESLSTAFYRDARDVTKTEILADIAAENGLDRATFFATLVSTEMRDAVKKDFDFSQSLGIQGFPTLCAGIDNKLHVITNGYASAATLDERLKQLLVDAK